MVHVSADPAEVDPAITHRGEAGRPSAVIFRDRLWQMGQKVVNVVLAVLEDRLEPPLDARALGSPTLPIDAF